jgi:glutamine cyclotransferase
VVQRHDHGNGWGANSGVSNMQANGQQVIIGQDPNQMAVRRMVDFGG